MCMTPGRVSSWSWTGARNASLREQSVVIGSGEREGKCLRRGWIFSSRFFRNKNKKVSCMMKQAQLRRLFLFHFFCSIFPSRVASSCYLPAPTGNLDNYAGDVTCYIKGVTRHRWCVQLWFPVTTVSLHLFLLILTITFLLRLLLGLGDLGSPASHYSGCHPQLLSAVSHSWLRTGDDHDARVPNRSLINPVPHDSWHDTW